MLKNINSKVNNPKQDGIVGTKKTKTIISIAVSPEAADKLKNVKNKSEYINNLILGYGKESKIEKDIQEIKEMLSILPQVRSQFHTVEKPIKESQAPNKSDLLENAKTILGDFDFLGDS